MAETLSRKSARRLVGLELNAQRATEILPESFEGTRVSTAGTPIYDISGELLFYRSSISRGKTKVAYADVSANPALGGPLLSTSYGAAWKERDLKEQAVDAARKQRRSLQFTKIRFVAYSFPKVAVQFLEGNEEVLMLELYTWKPVPRATQRDRKALEPGHFERWSFLEETPARRKKANAEKFEERLSIWDESTRSRQARQINTNLISVQTLKPFIKVISLVDRRELHYSTRNSDHFTCYEVRGQETNVWCVGASTQMLLDFYRYEYTQVRLAQVLGLGTKASPNGLSYSNVGDVVTQIEALTSNALNATMFTNPGWSTFRNEIRANRPLISIVPGHCRTIAGYTRSLIALAGQLPYRGLLVYDPWPPNAGVITRWENFDTTIHQYAYKAQVTLV